MSCRTVVPHDEHPLYRFVSLSCRALEGVFRSVNNLLERLHHAEFFYYTASQMHFISIGLYMPPFGLLLAPIVLEISLLPFQSRDHTETARSILLSAN